MKSGHDGGGAGGIGAPGHQVQGQRVQGERGLGQRSRRSTGRTGALALVMAVTAAALFTTTAAPAAAAGDPQVPVSMLALDRPVYDRYEPVVIEVGAIGFFPSCPTGGVRDFIYPWADVYIVRGASAAIGSLSDVNGAPNTVGGSGGGVFGEVIGYAGVNSLTSGTYSLVVDECQDGKLDYNDTLIPAAFRVTSRTSVEPMLGIASFKASAQQRQLQWEKRGRDWKVLLAINEALGYASAFVSNPPMVAIGIGISSFVSTKIQGLATGMFPDPKAIVATHNTNMARHWKGIAKDPHDPSFDQVTTVAGSTVAAPVYDDPLFEAASAMLASGAAEADLAEALLHSIERYQGADAAGDGTYALLHARQAQAFARLLADQLDIAAPSMTAAATALDADPRPYDDLAHDVGAAVDDIFASGLSSEQQAFLGRSGMTRGQLSVELSALAALDLGSFAKADAASTLRDLAADGAALATELETFADGVQPLIDGLEADPWAPDLLPTARAGGPYTATAGGPVAVNASGSTAGAEGAAIVSYEWDLDGDGAFDDATGAIASGSAGSARTGLVGMLVTDLDGYQGAAYAPITVSAGSVPSATTSQPADDGATVALGESLPMAFSVPGATTRWWVDGIEVHSGSTFAFAPSAPEELGARRVRAEAATGNGTGVARDWTVTVVGPDADGDGYSPVAPDPAQTDCDDGDPSVYPGAPELLDSKDNDCNPASPDGGVAPAPDAGDPVVAPEGGPAALVNARFTTTGATYPFTASVDWGDGTSASATISSSGNRLSATHAYADDGTYPVEVCVRSGTGMEACDQTTATISNEAATPLLVSLHGWSDEWLLTGGQGAPEWIVAPDGQSVFQSRNSNPSFFISDQPLIGTEAQVSITVEKGAGDDDFAGFALGMTPGDVTNPDARYLVVDWKQGNQGDTCGTALRGLALSYVTGIPHSTELWAHNSCNAESPSTVTELARGINLGSTSWVHGDTHLLRITYTATSLKVWVDEVLELDVDLTTLVPAGTKLPDGSTSTAGSLTIGDLVGDTFPIGNLAFFNHSQGRVRYAGYQLSALSALEGTPRAVTAEFRDPGTADTHSGRFDFGDGTPEDAVMITEVDGAGTATASHTYAQEGDFPAEVCVTDDDGGVGCQAVEVRVSNLAPVVDAGHDQVGGPAITLDDVTFTDLGILDTHSATVDWGDGGGPEPVATEGLRSELGQGGLIASYTYATPGTYEVEVCVTDDSGDTGCDTVQVAVPGPAAPAAETVESLTVLEGDSVEGGVAYVDLNTSEDATITVDWGDGTVEPASVQSKGGQGAGLLVHVYDDDGTYTVRFEVCDETDRCDEAIMTVVVGNVAPTVASSVGSPAQTGDLVTVAGTFTDPGESDTHTATVDWGDGAAPAAAEVVDGTVAGTHRYAAAGEYTVLVCVTDDDGGQGCATSTLSVSAAPDQEPPDPTDPPDPADPAPVTPADPPSTPPPATTTTTAVAAGTLPRTGAGRTIAEVRFGSLLVLLGGAALVLTRGGRRRAYR